MTINIIGVDPGPCTGVVTLHWPNGDRYAWWPPVIGAYQCSSESAPRLLGWLLSTHHDEGWDAGQIESFVVGNLPPSPTTIRMVSELADVAEAWGLHLTRRPMAAVKPWANENRLKKSGLITAVPAKMVDAIAAGRHALYCAVRDAGVPDPLLRGTKAS